MELVNWFKSERENRLCGGRLRRVCGCVLTTRRNIFRAEPEETKCSRGGTPASWSGFLRNCDLNTHAECTLLSYNSFGFRFVFICSKSVFAFLVLDVFASISRFPCVLHQPALTTTCKCNFLCFYLSLLLFIASRLCVHVKNICTFTSP